MNWIRGKIHRRESGKAQVSELPSDSLKIACCSAFFVACLALTSGFSWWMALVSPCALSASANYWLDVHISLS
jgi:hypothetical protein